MTIVEIRKYNVKELGRDVCISNQYEEWITDNFEIDTKDGKRWISEFDEVYGINEYDVESNEIKSTASDYYASLDEAIEAYKKLI